ncbi:MAG: hypothetical protein AAB641_01780 [Patescibacteria group bacterium]
MSSFDWWAFSVGSGAGAIFIIIFVLFFLREKKEEKVDHKARKARDTERNIGNRIIKILHMRTAGGMFDILSNHLSWKQGYQITLRNQSKYRPPSLLIVVDCSLPADRQLGVGTTDSDFKYYPANDEGVQGVLDEAIKYMETISLLKRPF